MRRGHAFECRLYAEDPSNNFFPCIGKIISWKQSQSQHVRYDTGTRLCTLRLIFLGIDSGSEISIYYDPLVSKIIAWGESREISRKLMIRALQETACQGLKTNKKFLIDVLQHEK